MKKIITVIMSGLLAASISTGFAAGTVKAEKSQMEVSYVQMSPVSDIKMIPGQKDDFVLTLRNVSPYVTYFSDRPNRVVGQVQTTEFLKMWDENSDSFSKDAPNAVLSGLSKAWIKNHDVNLVVELTQPVYDAKKATLSYHAHILKSSSTQALNFNKLHYATLFIDGGVCLTCVGN